MDFYFPDSQDQIDPRFDFASESSRRFHVRQRDDVYAHEAHERPPYTGVLVSKTMVDGLGSGGRYTSAQRHRLYRLGVRNFFRLPHELQALGDCGAFSYVGAAKPPISVEEVVDFYETCRFDAGISVDHVILSYRAEVDVSGEPEPGWLARQELTLDLAKRFLAEARRQRCHFTPVGVAQGWSPNSYAYAVERLQRIGYERIALGGMVPLKTPQILDCLRAIHSVRASDTTFHLLGVTRTDHVASFAAYGVTSFDSTSPFRQAFKDDRDNYYTSMRTYVALRVPPSDGNAKLAARIRAGQLPQDDVRRLEREALTAIRAYDGDTGTISAALAALRAYDEFCDGRRDRTDAYRETLEARPWKRCPCQICRDYGVEVAIFRGTERNKRRGFHNLWVFNETLQGHLAGTASALDAQGELLGESVV